MNACGCTIKTTNHLYDVGNTDEIVYCPLHASAEKLRDAVRLAIVGLEILKARMASCMDEHDVSAIEIRGWLEELRDTCAAAQGQTK